MGMIILNTIILCFKWDNFGATAKKVDEVFNYLFTVIFAVEATLKIIAYGRRYFKEGWNLFDFTVVIISCSF